MKSLRFLLVHGDPRHADDIAARLASENHTVLPTAGLQEATEALTVERFDAVLMDSGFYRSGINTHALQEFSSSLRQIAHSQRSPCRIPVIALTSGELVAYQESIDAVMPEPIDPIALTAAVVDLAHAVAGAGNGSRATASTRNSPTPIVFDPGKFREQVGFDAELMVEIIDLFLDERQRQEPEMRDALEAGEFDVLSRVAHTIKGSLGSLHAIRARNHAQDLEVASKERDEDVCRVSLAELEADLAQLEPELLALRHATVLS